MSLPTRDRDQLRSDIESERLDEHADGEPEIEVQELSCDHVPTPLQVVGTIKIESAREAPSPESKQLKYFTIATEFVKAIAWPSVILYLFHVLHVPIMNIVAVLPSKITQSTKVSVGSLSFEIQQAAIAAGTPQTAALIGDLSPSAIKLIMKIGDDHHLFIGVSDRNAGKCFVPSPTPELSELEAKGLIEYDEDPKSFDIFLEGLSVPRDGIIFDLSGFTEDQRQRMLKQGYRLSDKGKRAFELIVEAVAQLLQKTNDVAAK